MRGKRTNPAILATGAAIAILASDVPVTSAAKWERDVDTTNTFK